MKRTYKKIKKLFKVVPDKRISIFYLRVFPLSIINGLLDLFLVALTAQLTSKLVSSNNLLLENSSELVGNNSEDLLRVMILIVIVSWLGCLCKLVRLIEVENLAAKIWRDITNHIFIKVLEQPYTFFIKEKSTSIIAEILINVQRISYDVVRPLLIFSSNAIVIIFIAFGLYFTLGISSIILMISIGLMFIIASMLVVPLMKRANKELIFYDRLSAALINETFFSVRDIHLNKKSFFFQNKYRNIGEKLRYHYAKVRYLPDLPRQAIEPLTITFLVLIALLPQLFSKDSNPSSSISFIGTFIIAAAKLIPPLQDVFRNFIVIKGAIPEIDSALNYIDLPNSGRGLIEEKVSSKLKFPKKAVSLSKVSYKYPNSDSFALKNISLTFPVGKKIAIIGETGSGKSTLCDILLGHLNPSSGSLNIDGKPLHSEDIGSWQDFCSEVPQNIRLMDTSLKQNIAFGEKDSEINEDNILSSIESASLKEFLGALPEGLNTEIGENGVNLSGGQRQRIAISRVFYKGSKFIILDEATSSLDDKTEKNVIESLDQFGSNSTLVVIAHRLKTISKCDIIYEVNDGKLVCEGNYDDLCNPNHLLGKTIRI